MDKIASILEWVLKLKIIPQGWLTVIGGFGAVCTGAGALICHYTGACQETLPPPVAMTVLSGGLVAVGFGRRNA